VVDALHRDVALAAVALLVLHVVTTVLDSFAPIGLLDVVVPFRSAYRPLWLGLGALAFDLLLALTLTSLLRRRLGFGAWRAVHWAAYACWPLALVHGLGTGSDTRYGWMLALTLACVLAVLAAAAWRLQRRAAIPLLGALALLLAAWVEQGPVQPGWARRSGTPAALLPARATVASLPRTFTAAVSGTLAEQRSADGSRASLHLPLAFDRGTVDVRIEGRVSAGGVTLDASSVTLGPATTPSLYRGRVTALAGTRLSALVRQSGGDSRRLRLDLSIDGADIGGTITAEPGA
jgi:hypothetical protein